MTEKFKISSVFIKQDHYLLDILLIEVSLVYPTANFWLLLNSVGAKIIGLYNFENSPKGILHGSYMVIFTYIIKYS